VAAAIGSIAGASVIKDPDPSMGLDSGSLSDPISTQTIFRPINGGGVFGFFNAGTSLITQLIFQTTILPNLTPQQIAGVFTCNDANTQALPNPFFLNCAVNYTQDGALRIDFFGVNPPTPDPFGGDLVGLHEGIPPILPGCRNTPDAQGCTDVGHFLITLNDGFLTTGANGGWSPDRTPGVFTADGPTFGVAEIDLAGAPEPATAVLSLSALLALAVLGVGRRART
jgi:hypothetical protein